MRQHSEKHPSENSGTRRADRMPDQGGRRGQEADKARQEREQSEAAKRTPEPETIKQK